MIGWISQEDPVDLRLFEVMTSVGKGQTSQVPAMSPSGWHIFKIDDVRPHRVRTPDRLAAAIRSYLMEREIENLLTSLRATSTIEIYDRPEGAG